MARPIDHQVEGRALSFLKTQVRKDKGDQFALLVGFRTLDYLGCADSDKGLIQGEAGLVALGET